MQPSLRSRALFAAALLISVSLPGVCHKLDVLTRALLRDPSYKVRVQAALVLGKMEDRRALPALLLALRDDNPTVRGAAASMLGRIGDRSAEAALLEATSDSAEFVRTQARRALEQIAAAAERADGSVRFHLEIGFVSKDRERMADPHALMVREALVEELGKLKGVSVSAGSGKEPPPARSASERERARRFLVDGAVRRMSVSQSGDQVHIECDVNAYVATSPGRSIKMMTNGGATVQQAGQSATDEVAARRECLSAAAEAIREDVSKFLKTVE